MSFFGIAEIRKMGIKTSYGRRLAILGVEPEPLGACIVVFVLAWRTE